MAVIHCPACNQKISDKAKTCSHCEFDLTSLDGDKLAAAARSRIIKKRQFVMNISYLAMILLCGGFLFMYWKNPHPHGWQYIASVTSVVVGFVLYIITRMLLIFLKKKLK